MTARSSKTHAAQSRHVDVDGLRVHVRESGDGFPVLLIMGIGGHIGMWRHLEDRLHQAGIRTIAFDAPGTGLSSAYRLPRRLSGMARTVEKLLDTLGYESVDVLGVSFGGWLAQQIAHQIPHRVRRLVLCATSAGMVALPGRPRALVAMATPRRYWDPNYYERVAPRVFGGRARLDPGAGGSASGRFTHPPSLWGYAQQLFAVAGWTSVTWLSRLRQPTLVLAGDDDPLVPLTNSRLLAHCIPNADLRVVSGGGHLFLLEQADVSADYIAPFLTA